jgi:heme A synthase
MADPIWPTYPWHLALISWKEPSVGYIVEHTHRLFDYLLGGCCILLAIGLWHFQKRRWLGWLGLAALGGVIVQGLLGGFRVRLNALVGTDLALIHGLFAQLVFALLMSLALFTSRGWSTAVTLPPAPGAARIWRLSACTAVLVFVQLIFGALLRHTTSPLGQNGHILFAVAIVTAVAWLVKSVFDKREGETSLAAPVGLLAALVVVQVLLGVKAFFILFGTSVLPELLTASVPQALVRSAHFVLGSLIFGTTVAVAVRARRRFTHGFTLPVAAAARLEGAA